MTLPMVADGVARSCGAIDIAAFVFARALERPYLLCVAIMLGYVLLIVSLQATLLQPVA